MTDQGVVLSTLVVFQLGLVALGFLARGRAHNEVEFFLGGRRLGPLLAAVGASASSSSAWTLLGVSGAAYAWGLSAVWLFPACVGGFVLNWLVVAPALSAESRRTGALTLVELLAGPRGTSYRRAAVGLGSVVVLGSLGAYVASQFQAVGKTLGTLAGLPLWQSVLLGAGAVLLYTMIGGLWAVALTDLVQGLVMVASAVALPLATLSAVGGPHALLEGLSQVETPGFHSWGGARSAPLALGFVAGLLGIGLGYPGQPHVVKYFMALRDEPGTLRRARIVAISWGVLIYAGMILLGWCGRLLLPGLADRETVFIEASRHLFPPVLSGVMLAAVLSAILSTVDSQLLVASSTLMHDLGLGGHGPSALRRSRAAVALLTAGAAAVSLVGPQDIFSRVLFAWTALGAAFGPLVLVRAVTGRAVPPGRSLAAMACGFVLAVGAAQMSFGDLQGFAERVVPFAVALAIAATPAGSKAAR